MIRNGTVDKSMLCGHSVHNANRKRIKNTNKSKYNFYIFQYSNLSLIIYSFERIHQGHMKNT